MKQELIELLKKEGKRKESSFNTENSLMEESTTMPRIIRKEGSPSPFSRHMASSASFTSQRPSNIPKRVNFHSQASSPLQQKAPKNNTPIVNIRPKYHNLWLDGKEVERFIKRVENLAEIEGASDRDIARQISFWTKDQEISYHIEEMAGYGTGGWEELKLTMKRIGGEINPERRYKLSSMTQLLKNI
ncbi:hypothetical protein O181_001447 [Austropuccinia psidii MF-1]|uniref:Uncharacterized protein n=1 Tax=Austropuccinia psidii MF-1 TaxID=1389203 RepID=A0A9Q3BAU1_9BASI|nr:hypothetical protein [Austropuccinia psidii MF-1]